VPYSGPFTKKVDQMKSCREIYKKGAELAVEVALQHPGLLPNADAKNPSEICEGNLESLEPLPPSSPQRKERVKGAEEW